MVHRDRSHIYEFGEIVLVWYVVAVPRNDIKWAVLLGTLEELSAKFVDNLPGIILRNFVSRRWVQEVASICESVSS